MFFVTKEFSISASHKLRDYEGACKRLHGHNYKIQVSLRRETLNELGMVCDFKDLKKACMEVIDNKYDHRYLNDIEPFEQYNPTAENMAYFFFKQIEEYFRKNQIDVIVDQVAVWETDDSCAIYSERK